jgi:toxin YoeB
VNKQKTSNKQQAKGFTLAWTDNAWEDYLYWQKQDMKILEEINNLLEECQRHPFTGTGKPEPLRNNLTGFWSRRINKEHRLVYLPEDKAIYVVACRFHYGLD